MTSSWSGSNAATLSGHGPDLREHPAPVGVVAEHRGLEQVGAGHGPGDRERGVLRLGAHHGDRDVVRGALGVGDQGAGELAADLRERGGEARRGPGSRGWRPRPCSVTVSEVDMQPSESTRSNVCARRGAQRGVGGLGVDDGVGRDDAEHRGQAGGEHARRPWPCRRRSTRPGRRRSCMCAVLATVSVVMIATAASGPPVGRERLDGDVDAVEDLVDGQPLADQTGRADHDVARGDLQGGADRLGGQVHVEEALGPGAHVGAAGVEHDRADDAVGDGLPRPDDGRADDAVGGEHGRGDLRAGRR